MKGKALVAGIVLVGVVALVPPAPASAASERNYGSDAGYGTLAALANLVYMPLKLTYALVGGVTGTLAYLVTVGNLDAAQGVWSPSLGGTYVITPAMLRGEDEFLPSGPSFEHE